MLGLKAPACSHRIAPTGGILLGCVQRGAGGSVFAAKPLARRAHHHRTLLLARPPAASRDSDVSSQLQ